MCHDARDISAVRCTCLSLLKKKKTRRDENESSVIEMYSEYFDEYQYIYFFHIGKQSDIDICPYISIYIYQSIKLINANDKNRAIVRARYK